MMIYKSSYLYYNYGYYAHLFLTIKGIIFKFKVMQL